MNGNSLFKLTEATEYIAYQLENMSSFSLDVFVIEQDYYGRIEGSPDNINWQSLTNSATKFIGIFNRKFFLPTNQGQL